MLILEVEDFLLKEDSLDSLSKLDSVVELDDNGEREGHNDDADETKIKKKEQRRDPEGAPRGRRLRDSERSIL